MIYCEDKEEETPLINRHGLFLTTSSNFALTTKLYEVFISLDDNSKHQNLL